MLHETCWFGKQNCLVVGRLLVVHNAATSQCRLEETNQQIDRLEKLLSSPFAQKAPADVVQKERDRLAAFQETAEKIQSQLNELG